MNCLMQFLFEREWQDVSWHLYRREINSDIDLKQTLLSAWLWDLSPINDFFLSQYVDLKENVAICEWSC